MAPLRTRVAPIATSDLPFGSQGAFDLDTQAAYLFDAFASDDPALVVLALKEIGTLRRIPVVLDEKPALGEVMRTVRTLGFDLTATQAHPNGSCSGA